MPKHEALTPKAIANRIKAKGLQKLRWFCQMCQKQCRDENGYKCHCLTEAHIRQMQVFAENPEDFMSEYSQEFEKGFLAILRRKGGRVHANVVYQEYIADRVHVHMNATIWDTLSTFVQYLGRTGKAIVDQTPKGWFAAYVNRDPDVIAKQEALLKKGKEDLTDEERQEAIIQQQMETARQSAAPHVESVRSRALLIFISNVGVFCFMANINILLFDAVFHVSLYFHVFILPCAWACVCLGLDSRCSNSKNSCAKTLIRKCRFRSRLHHGHLRRVSLWHLGRAPCRFLHRAAARHWHRSRLRALIPKSLACLQPRRGAVLPGVQFRAISFVANVAPLCLLFLLVVLTLFRGPTVALESASVRLWRSSWRKRKSPSNDSSN